MKSKLLIIAITATITTALIFTIVYFVFGLNAKPKIILSLDSPNGQYVAYVMENPAIDPPNQSLFIAKNRSNEFRLVANLPEDIEMCDSIYWSPNSKAVSFTTNWHVFITRIEGFNTQKVSINPDWWIRMEKGTFRSSNRPVKIKEFSFINTDTISYKTNLMENHELIFIGKL